MYYNSTPWVYQPGMDASQMVPNGNFAGEEANNGFSHLNMGPSVVPVLPWLP